MPSTQRPRFEPSWSWCGDQALASKDGSIWSPIISCPADSPLDLFSVAVLQLVNHPEYNSTLILRSEPLSTSDHEFPTLVPKFDAFRQIQTIHRRLLPRRPERDDSLEQYCTLYAARESDDRPSSLMVLSPVLGPDNHLPYYHPTVTHLAFRYISSNTPIIRVEVLPLPGTATDPNSRLYRTCLGLLDTVHRYSWGAMTNYRKRVLHDVLVPRDTYQDLYLVMRKRHKHLVDQWQETTDPLKHVFEDIGIVTYLMLIWKDTFRSTEETNNVNSDEPWRQWPRPPGGFLDLGCGNGLLTHILVSEGYDGHGIDLRARRSWDHYPDSTRARLHVHPLDPTGSGYFSPLDMAEKIHLRPGTFVIGNHADELTPWIPVLSTQHHASGYLSIPCCAWSFDERFERFKASIYQIPTIDHINDLNLGSDGNTLSSYSTYRIWLASLSLHCGWEIECENLRIPSTRNWAIIGRRKRGGNSDPEKLFMENTDAIIQRVRERGMFKARKPEGNFGDH